MSRKLTLEISEAAFAALERRAEETAVSPAKLAGRVVEDRILHPTPEPSPLSEAEIEEANLRFERHFGAVRLGRSLGSDNDSIEADIARGYAHEKP